MKKLFADKYESALSILLLFIVVFSVFTYFTSLNQYATADQTSALSRMQTFLLNSDSINLGEGYSFSNVVVAIPGKALQNIINKHYTPHEHIIGNIHNTERLSYTFFQVVVSLTLLFYLTVLLFQLTGLKISENLSYYLLLVIIIINYPMIKGLSKLIKMDSLSQMASLVAVLHYILFRKNGRKLNLICSAVFMALSFIQKNTAFSVIPMMIVFEIIFLLFKPGKNTDILKSMLLFIIMYAGVFFITCYIFIPKIWLHPSRFSEITFEIDVYIKAFSASFIVKFLVIFSIFFFFIRKYINKRYPVKVVAQKTGKLKPRQVVNVTEESSFFSEKNIIKACYILFAVGAIVCITAIIYQKNNIICITTADPETVQKIRRDNVFVTPDVFGWSYTTMDKGKWVTTFKMFYNQFRMFIYMSPLVSVVLLFISFLLIALGFKKKIFTDDFSSIVILVGIGAGTLFAYSLLFALPEPRYNLFPNMLLVLFGAFIGIKFISQALDKKWKYAVVLILTVGMIRPIVAGSPTYMGYMNLLRNAEAENTDFLDTKQYCNWTWVGWGEASYGCYQFIEKNYPGKQKIMYSYVEPFYFSPDIESVAAPTLDYDGKFDNNNFRTFLQYAIDQGASFFIANKNRAFRESITNFAVKNYRAHAIYVDKVGEMEYAWMFDVKKLFELSGGPTADYYVNISSEKFKEGKYSEVIEYCKKGIKIDSNNLNAYINMAVSYINLNSMDEALKAAEKSVKIDSTSELARNNLNYIKSRIKN